MRNLKYIYIIALASMAAVCSPKGNGTGIATLSTSASARGPYLTHDHQGRPVICWTEKNDAGVYRLSFALYDATSRRFGPAIAVGGSEGISTSPESMGKIAFKSDGTVVAVFAKPFKQEKNPFAGGIYYSMSNDMGATWSPPKFLHTDTAHHYGRNFFDIARLGNGEVGAVWLDGRDTTVQGSTLYFAATGSGTGFNGETVVHRGTCECCRTDLLVDDGGTIHVAYRSIMYPTARFGEQVRDMAYVRSEDNGQTFSNELTISPDNWAIRACPHSGPALAAEGEHIHALWFTAGGGSALYHTHTDKQGFKQRTLISQTGSHPQLALWSIDTVVAVYEDAHSPHTGAHHHHESDKMPTAVTPRVVLHPIVRGQPLQQVVIADHEGGTYPVATRMDKGILVAWMRETANGSAISYTIYSFADKPQFH
ncbi:hypothetical protein SAMN05421747_101425 [Parapedobacter composti]|uniref:BNR repeat-like domain-containing protein n=1 Tax=Parapedobacter composti TaxID=623281 RepID=A0A1I1EFA4_9SPHI|nr:sialidase family protein [Parapedobacter composti]SFB83670.1 hypothetical protein SAMN05421747_101425 [Parapedobacter composti]